MVSAIEQYGAVSREYNAKAQEFGPLASAAADAEAIYKREKAKFKIALRDSGSVRSDAEAETRAEADDYIAGLMRERLLTAAVRDSMQERLRELRSRLDFGRSVVSNEREVDRLHAHGGGP